MNSNAISDDPLMVGCDTVMHIWPGLAPGEVQNGTGVVTFDGDIYRRTDVLTPRLFSYPPTTSHVASAPVILLLPGGGYNILAETHEGSEIAAWLTGLGFHVYLLLYRVPGKRDSALQDAQRSLSLIRSLSQSLHLDAEHVGMLGFSAGGHLTARTAVSFATRSYAFVDNADTFSCRPDFAMLIYPAYLVDISTSMPAEDVVPIKDMCPVFLMQTKDDHCGDYQIYIDALVKIGIPVKSVVYDEGGHGYGLRKPKTEPVHAWPDVAASWVNTIVQ